MEQNEPAVHLQAHLLCRPRRQSADEPVESNHRRHDPRNTNETEGQSKTEIHVEKSNYGGSRSRTTSCTQRASLMAKRPGNLDVRSPAVVRQFELLLYFGWGPDFPRTGYCLPNTYQQSTYQQSPILGRAPSKRETDLEGTCSYGLRRCCPK